MKLSFVAALVLAALPSTTAIAQIRFHDITATAGLREPLAGMMGHGAAWGDVNGDGHVDAFIGGFSDRPNEEYLPASGPVSSKLMLGQSDGTFRAAENTAAEFYGRISGALFVDLDNDGDLDLYSANNTKGRASRTTEPQRSAQLRFSNLFENREGRLIDTGRESGANPERLRTARNIGALDYDADGLLDLLVVEDKFIKNPSTRLFRNLGELRFRDVTQEVGLPEDLFGLGLAVADLNNDSRPDFFVGHSNRMFLSTGDGKYSEPESLRNLFAWEPLDAEDWPCGAAFGDLNNDGLLDLVLAVHYVQARNRIYLNRGLKNGVPQFEDITKAAGLPPHEANKSPHVEIQDFDNDGRPDLFFSTAWKATDGAITPVLYRNTGNNKGIPQFELFAKPPAGAEPVYFASAPTADFDADGRRDLLMVNWFSDNHTRLLRNTSPQQHWLDVAITGHSFNRMGLGSRISLYEPGKASDPAALLGTQELSIGYGYASGQEALCHFGLGPRTSVDMVVQFPNGTQMEQSVELVDRKITLEEKP